MKRMNEFRPTRRSVAGLLAAGLFASGVFGTNAALGQQVAIQERTLRMSFVNVKEHPHGLGAERFAQLVNQKSGGKLTVKLFAGGTLGSDMQMVSSLQGGTVDLSVMVPGSLTGVSKDFGVYDLPFLFRDAREADVVVDGPFGKKLLDRLPEKNLVGLAYWDHGFRNMTTGKKPIATADDFQGLKLRVQQIPIYST